MRSITIYMSTSTLENAIETLLNAGCVETREQAVEQATKHLEHVFPIQVTEVTEEFHPAKVPVIVLIAAAFAAWARVCAVWKKKG